MIQFLDTMPVMAVNGALGDRDAHGDAGRAADGQNVGRLDAEGEERVHPPTLWPALPARSLLFTATRLHQASHSTGLLEERAGYSATLGSSAIHPTAARLSRRGTEAEHHVREASDARGQLSRVAASVAAVHQARDAHLPEPHAVLRTDLSEAATLCAHVPRRDAEDLFQEIRGARHPDTLPEAAGPCTPRSLRDAESSARTGTAGVLRETCGSRTTTGVRPTAVGPQFRYSQARLCVNRSNGRDVDVLSSVEWGNL